MKGEVKAFCFYFILHLSPFRIAFYRNTNLVGGTTMRASGL